MSTLDKYLQMLDSPKTDIRFEACERLRLVSESNEKVIIALEKAIQDKDFDVADAASRALRADIHHQMLTKLGRKIIKTETEISQESEFHKREESKAQEKIELKKLASITIVTTPSLENYSIKEYLGIVSAEVVIGTGILSEFNAGLSDVLGVRSDKFQSKLKGAKEEALKELRNRAYELHANAVLSVDLDYSTLTNNLLMVVANGTAVNVEPISLNDLITK